MSTILELIQTANTEHDIRSLITTGNNLRPSGQTRRAWLRAARQRRTELAVPFLTRAMSKLKRLIGKGGREQQRKVLAQ